MTNKPMLCVKISLAVLIVVLLGLYFTKQAGSYLLGPQIIIAYPQNGGTVTDSALLLKGRVFNTATLLINDHFGSIDHFGNFEMTLLLARGYNIINLTAQDKFGRIVDKKLEIVLK